ncbi:MAG: hypothetical protein J6U87_06735, partial [Clostridia bacterium]|nr:hypothetical protein [Clostridia bacterium]
AINYAGLDVKGKIALVQRGDITFEEKVQFAEEAGAIGILTTVLMCIPINIILRAVTDMNNIKAALPVAAAFILVGISMALTLIAGVIPSRIASKKDPVEALRSE